LTANPVSPSLSLSSLPLSFLTIPWTPDLLCNCHNRLLQFPIQRKEFRFNCHNCDCCSGKILCKVEEGVPIQSLELCTLRKLCTSEVLSTSGMRLPVWYKYPV
ncbi:hypothetical protein AKJ16_DCAP04108, partial [Drosera capensis]